MAKKGHLPKERAEDCKGEYEQVAYAFHQLIGQYLDPVLVKVVSEKGWLPDAKWQLLRQSPIVPRQQGALLYPQAADRRWAPRPKNPAGAFGLRRRHRIPGSE